MHRQDGRGVGEKMKVKFKILPWVMTSILLNTIQEIGVTTGIEFHLSFHWAIRRSKVLKLAVLTHISN